MTAKPDDLKVPARLGDAIRYATAVVTIGVDPDNPDCAAIERFHDPAKPAVCLITQASLLRNLADRLEQRHAPGRC